MVERVDDVKGLDIELEEDILKKNRELAEANRSLLDENNIFCIDFMGSVGAGKTSLISCLIDILKENYRIGVIGGDLTTTIDAEIFSSHGIPVVQINTGRECHLDANLVSIALKKFDLKKLDLLFIENVGNIICPSEFPLGAHKRVAVVSAIDSPYIVIKHPLTFSSVDAVALNKIDLAKVVGIDVNMLENEILKINSDLPVVRTSAKNKTGIDNLIKVLEIPE